MSTTADVSANAVGTIGEPFEAGLVNYLPALGRIALRLSGQVPDAEDLVQETVARALAHRKQFQPGTNLQAWLCTILRSIFFSTCRRRRRAPMLQSLESLEEMGVLYHSEGACGEASAEQVVLRRQVDETLLAALTGLPEYYRLAVVLCDVHGLSYAEAARVMRCAIGTVMSRLHRGRMRLRRASELLSGWDEQSPCLSVA